MLYQLQYLRAVAALLVVYFHANLQTKYLHGNDGIDSFLFGKSGVDLFFVLSGFVMWITTANRADGTADFYIKRIIRIVPLYWSLTLAAVAATLLVPSILKSTVFDLPHAAASLFFLPWFNPANPEATLITPVIVPGWTLNYEMYFYLLFGALLGLSKALRPYALIGLLALVFVACRLLPGETTAARFYGDSVVFEFAIGVFLGKLYLDGHRLSAAFAWPMIVLAGAAMIHNDWVEPEMPRLIGVGLPAAIVVAGFALLDFSRKPAIRWLSYLGDASFSLYLTHVFVLAGARTLITKLPPDSFLQDDVVCVLFFCAASVLVAVLVHHFYERPIDRYLRGLRRPRARSAEAAGVLR